jgi:hypothetical protein
MLWLVLFASGLGGCAEETPGATRPKGGFQFPVGLAVHPAGFALVVSSNVDLAYVGGSLVAVDLNGLARTDLGRPPADDPHFARFVLSEGGLGLDNFGGSVVLSADGAQAAVAVRETRQVMLLDLVADPGQGRLTMNCWPDERRPGGDYPVCEGARHVLNVATRDPFALLFADLPGAERLLVVGGLRADRLEGYSLDLAGGAPPALAFQYLIDELHGVLGINDLALAPSSGLVYAPVRFPRVYSNPVLMFDPALRGAGPLEQTDFFRQFLGGEVRSVAFRADGQVAGVLIRNPDMLVLLDTSLDERGLPRNRLLHTLAVGDNPSLVRARGDLFLVTCAKDDTLYAVDGRQGRLLAIREDICVGPFGLDFHDLPDGRRWVLVSCFEDGQVAILEGDPLNPGFLDVLARVGIPTEEQR